MDQTPATETAASLPPYDLTVTRISGGHGKYVHYKIEDSKDQFFSNRRSGFLSRETISSCREDGVLKVVRNEETVSRDDPPSRVMAAMEAAIQKSVFHNNTPPNVIQSIKAMTDPDFSPFNKLSFVVTSDSPLDGVCNNPVIKAMRKAGTPVPTK